MIAHTFNSAVILKVDMRKHVLKAVPLGEQVSMAEIAQKLGVSLSQARAHVGRLLDVCALVKTRRKGRIVYMRGNGRVAPRRESSVEFAGPRSVGRGLANW